MSRRGSEVWRFVGVPAPLAHDDIYPFDSGNCKTHGPSFSQFWSNPAKVAWYRSCVKLGSGWACFYSRNIPTICIDQPKHSTDITCMWPLTNGTFLVTDNHYYVCIPIHPRVTLYCMVPFDCQCPNPHLACKTKRVAGSAQTPQLRRHYPVALILIRVSWEKKNTFCEKGSVLWMIT